MAITIPTQIEKCKGAMLATAIGDALGWPNELRSSNRARTPKVNDHFVEWTRRCRNPRYHDEKILPGEYSDDTQMTLSVARSIIDDNWEKVFIDKELPFWLIYERGGGGALKKAAKSISEKNVQLWQSNYVRNYFNAGGNGAAMRILPHVIAAAERRSNVQRLMLDVIKNTLITHGHPRAFLGAMCYAFSLDYLLKKGTVLEYGELVSAVIDGQNVWGAFPHPQLFEKWIVTANQYSGVDYKGEWNIVFSNMIRQLDFIKDSLKKGLILNDNDVLTKLECFSRVNGAGDVAALTSIYLASRYANNPALGIKIPAFSIGADTDTIASMTGGLLGMLSGMTWIPAEWRVVQDYDCLVQMAEILYSDNKKEVAKIKTSKIKSQHSGWKASPIGDIRSIDIRQAPNGKNGLVIITKWQTSFGQTLYTKKFDDIHQAHVLNRQMQLELYQAPKEINLTQSTAQQSVISSLGQVATESRINKQKQFKLTCKIIDGLLTNPEFKQNRTVGKVFKVIQALIESKDSPESIAKQFDINLAMVKLLQTYVE